MEILSSSSRPMIWRYDVFVSFRGETRNNFTDHLFAALRRKGIHAFRDDTKLKKGEPISSELLQAIEGSQILIVVFSKDYASSTWCLQELAKIADCIEVPGQSVLPIFFDLNPSEARKQCGNYEQAFKEYEERFKDSLEKLQRWRDALAKVANLSGWDLRDKPQHSEIEKIIKEVTHILGPNFPSLASEIVGIHSHVEKLGKFLGLGSHDDDVDVRVLGICGMEGIGKTTLATFLYEKISHQYDVSCFIDDVSRIYGDYGPIGAPKQLLCQALNEEQHLQIHNLSRATYLLQTRLRHTKALIVLDNVDQEKQLEKVAMMREWLGAGSKIIIISRDQHILKEYGVDEIYKVQLLNYDDALQLFCQKAFKSDDIMSEYEKLTRNVLLYANGHPLAIKVLGTFLFGRDVLEWRSVLAKLRENPRKDIMDVLRISFDALDDMEKEIFLDIACFFNGEPEEYVKKILDFRGFYPNIGMRVLIDKSLITFKYGTIHMHDLLKELGKNIVREKSPKEPSKWTRLWDLHDLDRLLLENKASENLEAIVLSNFKYADIFKTTSRRVEALSQMSCLKLLKFRHDVNFSGRLPYLSNELRFIDWYSYPLKSLPSFFQQNKLVELILRNSSIEQLWEGTECLHNLRRVELCDSQNLTKMLNFGQVPNLEELNLEGCRKLVQIDPSIGLLRKLVVLNLENCINLVSIPWHVKNLEILDISNSAVQCQSTSFVYKMLRLPLQFFYYRKHEDSVGLLLPSSPLFSCLLRLNLSFCNLQHIPDAIGWIHSLEYLDLSGNNFVTLPCSMKELSKLIYLNLEHCRHLKYLLGLPSTSLLPLRTNAYYGGLYIFNCPSLSEMGRCCSMAISWMIQIIKVNMQSSFPLKRVELVIPKTPMPRWFDKQNVGSSIRMDPSPIMCDHSWIGVACCATFVTHEYPTDSNAHLVVYIGFGFRHKGREIYFRHICSERNMVTIHSSHLSLVFFTKEEFMDLCVNHIKKGTCDLDDIEFAILLNQHFPGEVKSCGYRWVFKEDLEHLKPTMMYSKNSSVQKPKCLEIDDGPTL